MYDIVAAVVLLGLSFSSFNLDSWLFDYLALAMSLLGLARLGLLISGILTMTGAVLVALTLPKSGRGLRGVETIVRDHCLTWYS